jgi:cobalamin biosynthesis Mg chelatase CobN
MLRVHRLLLSTIAALAVLAPAAQAQELEPGVSVDPNSPAGKEYALPVDSARKAAQGKTSKKKATDKKAPLFGEGVKSKKDSSDSGASKSGSSSGSGDSGTTASTPSSGDAGSKSSSSKDKTPSSKSGTSEKKKQSKAEKDRSDDSEAASTTVDEEPPPPAPQEVAQIAAQANQPTSGGGMGTALIIGAGGLAVLLLGGLAGLAMRRRGPGTGV